MKIGDLCWDTLTKTIWIVKEIWWCPLTENYKYDLMNTKDFMIITTNDTVATYMRADFLKRTNSVLYKSQ